MSKTIPGFIFLILMFACNNPGEKVKRIPDNDMIEIIKDMHIADATFQHTNQRKSHVRFDSIQFYDTIFQKYGYSRQQFDSTISKLSGEPEHYITMYEKVMADLSEYEAELEKENKEIKELYFKSNLWNKKENWNLPEDGEREKIEFEIPLKGPGRYLISTRIKMFRDDESINPKITAYFYKKDTTVLGKRQNFQSMSVDKNNVLKEYKIRATLSDSTFTSLRGAILDHTNPTDDWKKHVEVTQIKVIYVPDHYEKDLPR